MDIANLEKFARIKGLNLLGTGDLSHPKWLEELKQSLTEDGSGILKSKSGFNFILQGEISNIFKHGGKGRRIHNVILAKGFDIANQIQEALKKKGRIDYDGRPIFGFNCIELVEMMKDIDKSIEVIPAHVWTPWYSLFGSMSGFNSVEECFGDQKKHIHALETGLSSDPAMNWRLSGLDKYSLISNSDAHSFWPWRIGREANVFDIELSYDSIISALKTKKGFLKTIEVDPNYGKYHFDGHRNCNVCLEPKDSLKNNNICPKCGNKLTIGVLNRVEELADREDGFKPKDAVPFSSLVPLSEIISVNMDSGVATKTVWMEYNKLIKNFNSELKILMDVDMEELLKVTNVKIANAIIDVREGKIKVKPGYDGVYGQPMFNKSNKTNSIIQKEIIRNEPEIKNKPLQQDLKSFL